MLAFLASLAFASPAAPVEAPLDAAYDVVYVAGAELHWVERWYDWNTLSWVEGYWRPASRPGYVWVEGGYDSWGIYAPGGWVSLVVAPVVVRAAPVVVRSTVVVQAPARAVAHRRHRRVRR